VTTPLGRLVEINPGVPEFLRDPDAEVTFMPLECVWPDGLADTSRRAKASAVANGYTQFRDGDILLPKITPTFEAGRTFPVQIDTAVGAGTTELHVLRVRPGFVARFIAYVCRSQPFLQDGATRLQGVGNLRRVPAEYIAKFTVQVGDPMQQCVIADYLDRETAKIDTLIEEQRRLIEMLRERRAALVERTVARGLDSTVETKPSQLAWTDVVPAHWVVANIRRFATMKTGHTPSRSNPDYWVDCRIPWFTLADVWQLRDGRRTYLGDTANSISELGLANSAAELLPARTVVLSRTASVGFTGIAPRPMATSQDFWNWVCGPSLLPEFLVWTFRAMRHEFDSMMIGSTHKTIYQPVAASIRIPVPPFDEQRRIVDYLDEQTSKIDMLIAETEGFVELSRERRAALITAAVTGQIDVREAA
jgi:type I restriction enzyme, S subunit